jgi:hypothetical protein
MCLESAIGDLIVEIAWIELFPVEFASAIPLQLKSL